jgi:hypothetical protein
VAVHDLHVKGNDLVVGTNGRSIWILDDLTPIRTFAAEVAGSDVFLFETPPAIRWRYHEPVASVGDPGMGANPPQGSGLHYFLRSQPKDEINLDILDAKGNVVVSLSSKEEPPDYLEDDPDGPEKPPQKPVLKIDPGIHRIVWDLRYKGGEMIKGAKQEGNPRNGPLVLPGRYTARLRVAGKTLSREVQVLPDPRVQVSTGVLEEQLHFALGVRNEINRLVGLVNSMRAVRKQLKDRLALLAGDSSAAALVSAGKELIARLDALEEKLHNPRAQVSYDILAQKGGAQLYSQLIGLFEMSQNSDGPVTQGMREVSAEEGRRLKQYETELNDLWKNELAKWNELAVKLGKAGIMVP